MKKNLKLISLILTFVIIAVTSCKKEKIVDTNTRVGISKITNYADLTLKGDRYVPIVKGHPFVDSGAVATEKGKPLKVKVSGDVDINTPGTYTVSYSAINSDGYSASISRIVIVLPEPEKPGIDLSGKYLNNGAEATISKLASGFYHSTNILDGVNKTAGNFICADGINIIIPLQNGTFGPEEGDGTISSSGLIEWTITLPTQGPYIKAEKWQKQ